MSIQRLKFAALLFALSCATHSFAAEQWFEEVKATATPLQLYTFLYALPKGGDLHNHLTGAVRSEWMWDAALAQADRGYRFYTKVKIANCIDYGADEFGFDKYLMLFRTLKAASYERLDACQKSEYKRLEDLDAREKAAWLNSIRLDAKHENRTCQNCLQAHANSRFEISILAAALIKSHQAFEILGTHRPSIGLARYFRNDFCGAGHFFAGIERPANKYLPPARRIGHARNIEWAADFKLAQVRILDSLSVIADLRVGQRVLDRRDVVVDKLRVFLEKRGRYAVRAGFHGELSGGQVQTRSGGAQTQQEN